MNTDELRDPLPTPEAPEPEVGTPPVDAVELPPDESTESVALPAVEPAPSEELPAEAPVAAAVEVEAAVPLVIAAVEPETGAAEPEESYDLPQALFDAGFDVEAALGALSFEQDAAADDDAIPAGPRLPPFTPPNYRPRLPVPPPLRVRRGQLGSVLPALALIGVGAWLTVAQAAGTPVDPLLAGAALAGGLVLTFLAVWLTNGRWSRGLLLVVLLALLGAGGGALIISAGLGNALAAYPLLLSALGVAILLAAFLARPPDRSLLGPALVFITAGIVGYLVLNGAIPAGMLSGAAAYWFVPAIILLILVALPLFFRRRT